MASISAEGNRYSNVISHEYMPTIGWCLDAVTAYEAAETSYAMGTVLGKTLTSGTATAAAASGNTGNGAMGSVTVSGTAMVGQYTLRIIKAASNAGDFIVTNPVGDVVGFGTVGVAFSAGGLAFTLADGSSDFVVGDIIYIAVAGTVKYKVCKATATDGSDKFAGIYVGGNTAYTRWKDSTVAATTDTKVVALVRGNAMVKKQGLVFDASINTDAEKEAIYAQMEAKGILIQERVGTFATIG